MMIQNNRVLKNDMDLTVNPGADFYQYATGHWMDNNPKDKEYSSWGLMSMLHKKVDDQLLDMVKDILNQPCEEGSNSQKVRDLYKLFQDSDRLNRERYTPILPIIKIIDDCTCPQDIIDVKAKLHICKCLFLSCE